MSISSEQAHPDTRWGAVEEAGSDQVAEAVYVLNQDREAWLKYHASNWLRAFQESVIILVFGSLYFLSYLITFVYIAFSSTRGVSPTNC